MFPVVATYGDFAMFSMAFCVKALKDGAMLNVLKFWRVAASFAP